MILKQGQIYIRQFLMVLASDHNTGAVGATVTVKLGKNGTAGVGTSNNPVQVDSVNLPGVYSLQLSGSDTNTAGDLWYHCIGTSPACDPRDFCDQVQPQVFTDLALDANGRVLVSSPLKQGASFTALFFMTQLGSGAPAPGLTITGQRTFGVPGFSPISGSIAEVGGVNNGSGWYVLSGAAADTAACVGFKMTASGANDADFSLWFQP